MAEGTITANAATGSMGGGVHIVSGVFTMTAGTITNNTAATGGGGVRIAGGATFIMKGGTITANIAATGGGVYNSGYFTLETGFISSNTASVSSGGGIYSGGDLTLSSGTIDHNTAANGSGGGIFIDGGNATMGSTISYNTALNGGGVGIQAGTFTMTKGSIIYNSVSGAVYGSRGGGVYIRGGSFILEGGNNYGNTAFYGGGVCLIYVEDSSGRAVFKKKVNSVIQGSGYATPNTAGTAGAAVYISSPTKKKNSSLGPSEVIQYDSDFSATGDARYAGTDTTIVWD
jgi:predicted outer membrane repeat protein